MPIKHSIMTLLTHNKNVFGIQKQSNRKMDNMSKLIRERTPFECRIKRNKTNHKTTN